MVFQKDIRERDSDLLLNVIDRLCEMSIEK